MNGALTMGEAFPADDVLARWIVVLAIARNDLALATERIVRANEDDDGTNLHWHRHLAAHFFEAGRFLRRTRGITEVKTFVASLPRERQEDYEAVLKTAKRWSEKRLRRGRNRTFHYVDIAEIRPPRFSLVQRVFRRRRQSAGAGDISNALTRNQGRPVQIRGARRAGGTVTVDRFLFADEIAAHFTVEDLGEDATELRASLKRIAEEEVRLVQFAHAAIDRYQEQRGITIPTV